MEYHGIVFPLKNGRFAMEFPDIPEAFCEGESLEECLVNAREVLEIAIEEYEAAGKPLPNPSTHDKVCACSGESCLAQDRHPERASLVCTHRPRRKDPAAVAVSFSFNSDENAG